jgi:circadian clock protein KaiC
MKKEHPDWNFCPTCNASLAAETRSDVLGLLLTNPENRFVISASLSTGLGTGVLSPFSLSGDTKVPVWAEGSQLGSPGLTKERLFEEVVVQHVIPAFRNGFKLARYSGPEEDIHLFFQILIRYAQRDISDLAFNFGRSLSNEPEKPIVNGLGLESASPSNSNGRYRSNPQKKSLRTQYSPDDDPTYVKLQSENQISSGVMGLDNILGGGLPKNKVTLVSGHSGTGKTVLAAQFLIEGVKKGEVGIFALVGQRPTDVLEELDSLGLPILSCVREQKIFLIVSDEHRVFQARGADIINVKGRSQLLSVLCKIAQRKRASRIAIDSFTALVNADGMKVLRSSIREIFEKLSDLKCTTLLTGELQPNSQGASYYGIEETLASGVIVLGSKNIAERHTRYLYVPKMKTSKHSLSEYVFSIEEGIGIKIVDTLKAYSERLEPRLPAPQGGTGFSDLSNLMRVIGSMNPSLKQAYQNYEFANERSDKEAGNARVAKPYTLNNARSFLPTPNGQSKKFAENSNGVNPDRPQRSFTKEAKLTAAADGNPWASIISARKVAEDEKDGGLSFSGEQTSTSKLDSMTNQQDPPESTENV